jgi:hypothetical protein
VTEAVVAQFKEMSRKFSVGTEDNHGKRQSK